MPARAFGYRRRPGRARAGALLALLAAAACGRDAPDEADPHPEVVADLLDTYFHGLEGGDATEITLTPNVVLENPETRRAGEPIQGENEVSEFYEDTGANMADVEVERHVIEGPRACSILTWESVDEVEIPTVTCFEIEDEAIARIRTYYDSALLEDVTLGHVLPE